MYHYPLPLTPYIHINIQTYTTPTHYLLSIDETAVDKTSVDEMTGCQATNMVPIYCLGSSGLGSNL